MVHSGSASPMTTTPTASPHLTLPATAPPLQAAPLVPPAGDTTDQGLTQTPEKFITTDLTSKSDSTQPSPPTPADGEPAVVTPAKAFAQTPAQGAVNGRTSGRKRTPKACKCCGPNSSGHNVKTPSRGRGRGRGRGRDAGSDLQETAKRKPADGQLTRLIKSFDLTEETAETAEVEDGGYEKMQTADAQPQTVAPLPVLPVSSPDGPITNSDAPNKGDAPKKEEAVLLVGSGLADNAQGAGDGGRVALSSSGVAGRGAAVVRGRGVRAALAPTTSTLFLTSQSFLIPRSMLLPRQAPKIVEKMDHGSPVTNQAVVKSPSGNGETVNLCDAEPEQEVKEDHTIISEVENGLFVSLGSPQDLDPETHMDQSPNKTVLATLSNGSVCSPPAEEHGSTGMEVESSHPARVAPQPQGPITVSSLEHVGALKDHRLYCHTGTWVEQETGRDGGEGDEKMQDGGESLEQLIDLIHEFLESFYIKYGGFIPLSEDDVLEYLKKRGSSDISNRGLDIKGVMTRYRAGLASAPVAGFMVTYNKHTLGLEDLSTLEEQNWLNDQIINMYGELIMEATQQKVHFFNSFFHKQLVAKGYDGVKRWTKKVDLFSKWLLLIPIHLEIHWSLVTVTMATKTISYYDSQGIVFRHTTDNIMKYLLSEAREKKQTAFQKGWKITIIKGIPQQKNDSDCGVFVLEYCRRLSVKQPLLFSQEDMPRIRKRIYKELCDCHLND